MIIANRGGGKTTLADHVAEAYALPRVAIDTMPFQPQWQRTSEAELREHVVTAQAMERWVIDGFGPWDLIEERAVLADTIIVVDHPIWVHFWWACERQIAAARGEQRLGGPKACDVRDVTKLWDAPHVRTPEQMQCWTDLVAMVCNQLALARPLVRAERRPWEAATRPATPQ